MGNFVFHTDNHQISKASLNIKNLFFQKDYEHNALYFGCILIIINKAKSTSYSKLVKNK